MQFFTDLLNPLLYALSGQLRLTVFVDGQTHEVIVIGQAFRRFEVVTGGRPVAYNNRAIRLNDVADGASASQKYSA